MSASNGNEVQVGAEDGIRPILDSFQEETQGQKLIRKSKESPFMIIGLGGLVAACGIGAYQYRRRGGMSTSVFLMRFRVIAQGTAVGALTAGIGYSLYTTYIKKEKSDSTLANTT